MIFDDLPIENADSHKPKGSKGISTYDWHCTSSLHLPTIGEVKIWKLCAPAI